MTGMFILVHFDQGLCFRGPLTAMKRSILVSTKLKMHVKRKPKQCTGLFYITLFQNLKSKCLINIAPVHVDITKSPHAMLSISR